MAATISCGIAILLVTLFGVSAECPDGFTKHGTSCYTILHAKVDWSQATVVCKEINSHLLEIDDAAEESYIHGFLSLHWRAYDPADFWVGGNDILEEGSWEWASGKAMTYTNWDDGQPDNGGDNDYNEHCMEISHGDAWKWNDQECDEERNVICEIPITDVIGGGGNPGPIG
ncbi:perlucin-like [Pecten maximus]|uniref:perlucin-like n=1 Tax=Pecten maximus TaxID=6579 RepID=UPI0014590A27|nr:perlucin-like [Pecten maximus]